MCADIVCVVNNERRKRQWDAISAMAAITAHGLSFLSFSFAAAAATVAASTAATAVATAAATTTPTAAAAADC